jgi:hypothetical protein
MNMVFIGHRHGRMKKQKRLDYKWLKNNRIKFLSGMSIARQLANFKFSRMTDIGCIRTVH